MAKWKKRVESEKLGDTHSQILAGLMSMRGISPFDLEFLSASLDDLSDPKTLGDDVVKAADLMLFCNGKFAAVIGDYDADGIMSSALVKRSIEILGGSCDVFLPSRWKHGYGLNEKTVKDFILQFSDRMPDVLFVVDCGSSSEEYIVELQKSGVGKVVVIDHHIVDSAKQSKSADAHVNWRLSGTSLNLCAAGEVFQVARLAFMKAGLDWMWMLPFAAIATVGDSVPLTLDNRIIIKNGADYYEIQKMGSPGLCALASQRCKDGISQKSLAFYVVPRINAAGRISDPDVALKFILEKNPATALAFMNLIETFNTNRKEIQNDILHEGIEAVGGQDAQPKFVFLHQPNWNVGVCGISCSQMVEKYGVPAMMFGTYNGKIRGSGRSIPGVNIKAVLDMCGSDVFERYGGHEMACGAVVRDGMLEEAKNRFGENLLHIVNGKHEVHVKSYDYDLKPESVVPELGNVLFESLYPYCPDSNPEPIFKISGATVVDIKIAHYQIYSRISLSIGKNGKLVGLPLVTFLKSGVDDDIMAIKNGDVADFYFSFPQKHFSGSEFLNGEYILDLIDVDRGKND